MSCPRLCGPGFRSASLWDPDWCVILLIAVNEAANQRPAKTLKRENVAQVKLEDLGNFALRGNKTCCEAAKFPWDAEFPPYCQATPDNSKKRLRSIRRAALDGLLSGID